MLEEQRGRKDAEGLDEVQDGCPNKQIQTVLEECGLWLCSSRVLRFQELEPSFPLFFASAPDPFSERLPQDRVYGHIFCHLPPVLPLLHQYHVKSPKWPFWLAHLGSTLSQGKSSTQKKGTHTEYIGLRESA
ncbi:hypothetical protein LEMLEM_LOCUS15147, partial [Lemmus lemmus]